MGLASSLVVLIYFFCDHVKVEVGLGMGDDSVSLFRSYNALILLIDNDVLSFVMGDDASYFSTVTQR